MRLTSVLTAAFAIAAFTGSASAAQHQRQIGKETAIPFASNGGIRNWQAGPPKSGIIYVQDRRLDWYRVEMSGPCIETKGGPMTVLYTTDNNGRFDTFSKLTFPDYADRTCGVKSITTSLPPSGQPGAPKTPH
jgi:hypothetical protein